MISSEDKIAIYRSEKAAHFIPENALDDIEVINSPSGKYSVTVTKYKTNKENKVYTLGSVYLNSNKQLISEIQRDYATFPLTFVENHPNGHDYLVCSEDTQGQTVVELDTGEKVSWVPILAGFCWVDMTPSPSRTLIAVDGCYWACPYEIKIYDFSNPMKPPFECLTEDYSIEKFNGWNVDDTCSIYVEYETRKSDGKPIKDLSEEEEAALYELLDPGHNHNDLFGYKNKEFVWSKS
jgi:hypothetical protein